MAVRLREADNIAAMAELQQQISELEIQVKSQHPLPVCSIPLQPLHQASDFLDSLTNHITKLLLTQRENYPTQECEVTKLTYISLFIGGMKVSLLVFHQLLTVSYGLLRGLFSIWQS